MDNHKNIDEEIEQFRQLELERRKKFYSRLQEDIRKELHDTYFDAEEIIKTLNPPSISAMMPKMPLDEIIQVLQVVKKTAINTLLNSTIPDVSLSGIVKAELYEDYLDEFIPKVAYGIISMTSRYVLNYLTLYISKECIFSFLKENIVRPDFKKYVEDAKNEIAQRNYQEEFVKDVDQLSEKANRMVYDLMITMNGESVASIMNEIHAKPQYYNIIRDRLKESKYFVPDFLIDEFTENRDPESIRTSAAKSIDFLQKYIKTYSTQGLQDLFKDYTTDSIDLIRKTRDTSLERNAYHAIPYTVQELDTFDVNELKLIDRVITQTTITDDLEKINENEVIKRIWEIIEKNKNYNMTVMINNLHLTIKSYKGNQKFLYRPEGVIEDLNDPFNVFGQHKDIVKSLYFREPNKSCLTQTCLPPKMIKDLITPLPESFKQIGNRITHRNQTISSLIEKFKSDNVIMNEVNALLNASHNEIKHLNYKQFTHYAIEDDRKALLVLAETEGIYRKIQAWVARKSEAIQQHN